MPQFYTLGELAAIIKMRNAMDIEDLGSEANQLTFIAYYVNISMWELAKLADWSVESDAMTLSADGNVTFTASGIAITDMYEPKRIMYTVGGVERSLRKRSSDEDTVGWWRESQNSPIHIKGFSASPALPSTGYKLKYLKYPKKVSIESDEIQFPPQGYETLINMVSAKIKEAKNSLQDAEYLNGKAKTGYNNVAQAGISARGTGSTGQPIGINDATQAKG
jgi:hypothetical protein